MSRNAARPCFGTPAGRFAVDSECAPVEMPGAKGVPACPDADEEMLPPTTVAAAIRNTRDVYFAERDRFMGLLCLPRHQQWRKLKAGCVERNRTKRSRFPNDRRSVRPLDC